MKKDSDYEYLHLSPRDRQIKVIEENATPDYLPGIKKAYDHIVGIGEKIESSEDIDNKIERIFALAKELSIIQTNKRKKEINFPEALINSNEAIKNSLPAKFINKWRKIFFNSEDPPFLNNPQAAVRWLDQEAKRQEKSLKRIAEKNQDEISKLENEMSKLKKEILKRVDKLRILNPKYKETRFIPSHWAYDKEPLSFMRNHIMFEAIEGTLFGKLNKEIREISRNSIFSPEAILVYMFTGIKPIVHPFISIRKLHQFPRAEVKVQTKRMLTKKEIEWIYQNLKKYFGKQRKRLFTEKNLNLYDLVEKYGGYPQKNKQKFWEKIHKEWNEKYPDNKLKSPDCLRVIYKRIKNRISF